MFKFKPTFLFGGTSIIGWNLILNDEAGQIKPFCNIHTPLPACREWDRFNLEDGSATEAIFKKAKPDILIHCAGVCDVEKCEKFPEWARKINVSGIEKVLEVLPEEVRLVYVSSDHVFSGDTGPYDELSKPDPISVYGETRVQAEKLVLSRGKNTLVVRPGLGIGPSIDNRSGTLNWMQYRTRNRLPITIVQDEYRSAVWAKELAERLLVLAESHLTGLRHVAAKAVSRVELAQFLNEKFEIGAQFRVIQRNQKHTPHLGRVELKTIYKDEYAIPLKSIGESHAESHLEEPSHCRVGPS